MSDDIHGDLILLGLGAHKASFVSTAVSAASPLSSSVHLPQGAVPASLSSAGVRGSLGDETFILYLCRGWGKGNLPVL